MVKSYLTNRQQYVQVKNEKSDSKNVKMGVPQGSVLGTACNINMFADDTNLFLLGLDPLKFKPETEQFLECLTKQFHAIDFIVNDSKTIIRSQTREKCNCTMQIFIQRLTMELKLSKYKKYNEIKIAQSTGKFH